MEIDIIINNFLSGYLNAKNRCKPIGYFYRLKGNMF